MFHQLMKLRYSSSLCNISKGLCFNIKRSTTSLDLTRHFPIRKPDYRDIVSRHASSSMAAIQDPSILKRRKNRLKESRENPESKFLKKLQRKEIPSKLVCQQVEQLLLLILNRPLRKRDGTIALRLLDAALEAADLQNERLIPRLFSLTCQVIHGSKHNNAIFEMGNLVERLLSHRHFLSNDLEYNSHHVNDACAQFIKGAVFESIRRRQKLPGRERKKIESIIGRLNTMYNDPEIPLVSNTDSCNARIMYLCNQDKPAEAFELLKWMIKSHVDHPVDLMPRIMSFTSIISSYGRFNPEKSSEVLQWMLSIHEKGLGPAPNTSCFNALLDALAKSKRRDAGERAEQTLKWMSQLRDDRAFETAPDVVSFNTSIHAWANSPVPDAPQKAQDLLQKMISDYKKGNNVVPGNIAFNSAMNAWANSGTKEAPERVYDLIERLKSLAQDSNELELTSYSYAILLKAYENQDRRQSKHLTKRKVKSIFGVLDEMEQNNIEKTAIVHNSTIMALKNFCLLTGMAYFLEVEEEYRKGNTQLDDRTFNSALSAMALLNKPDVIERSMDIYQRMKDYSKTDSTLMPNETTFNIMMKIFSRSNSPDAALKADRLLQEREVNGNFKTSPISYSTIIIAWGRSPDKDKFSSVRKLLQRYQNSVKDGNIKHASSPTIYNAVLSVCKHNAIDELKDDALQTAIHTMTALRNAPGVRPDEITYRTLFEALNISMEGFSEVERMDAFESELITCAQDGLVSRSIIELIYNVCFPLFEKTFGKSKAPSTVDIPREWCKALSRDAALK